MYQAIAQDARAISPAIQKTSWNAANDGSATDPTTIVTEPRTAATAALDDEVPSARSRAFRPFADAVSVIGTDAMISVGIAA